MRVAALYTQSPLSKGGCVSEMPPMFRITSFPGMVRSAVCAHVCRAALLLLPLGIAACTDAGVQPIVDDPAQTFDNLISVQGEFCAQPDQQVDFPVKVLFMVDQSTSLQCTDSLGQRFTALNAAVDTVLASSASQVGFVGFSSWVRTLDFTRDRTAMQSFLDSSAGLGPATDYQGVLATAVKLLENDMREVDASERARTRYVVVFMSDGSPNPRCNQGCEDDITNCSDGLDNDGDGLVDGADDNCANINDNTLHPDNLSGICNFTGELDVPDDEYVEFAGVCPAYNQSTQILQRVRDVLELQDIYSVGSINLHTVLLFSDQAVVDGICGGDAAAQFGLEEESARALLQSMAAEGVGVFRDAKVSDAGSNDFLQFNFRALEASQALAGIYGRNLFVVRDSDGIAVDTDQDGLSDVQEQELGSNHRSSDSDLTGGDGYSDLFEERKARLGFDMLDAELPALACTSTADLDGDGLLDCEEEYLGLDPRHPDSDGDLLLDWVEVAFGTDPTRDDYDEDPDFDGHSNGDEVLAGSDPNSPDDNVFRSEGVAYTKDDLGRRIVRDFRTGDSELRSCYSFEVADMQMAVTPLSGESGLNRMLVYAAERPAQLGGPQTRVSVACFEAFYRGATSKEPESGVIDVGATAWQQTLDTLQTDIDGLWNCDWFVQDGTPRSEIESVLNQCLPDEVQLGRFLFDRTKQIELLRKYVAANGAVNLPQPASELFVALDRFDPEVDCYRPWELDYLDELTDLVATACLCEAGAENLDFGDGEAVSPCCDAP